MSDQSSTREWWRRTKNTTKIALAAGVFIVTTLSGEIITRLADPYITQLINGTIINNLTLPEVVGLNWTNSQLVSLVITAIVFSATTIWVINRAQDKTNKLGIELYKEKEKSKRDLETVYKSSNELLEKERRNFKQEIDSLRADGLNAIQENGEFWQNRLKEEQKETERFLGIEKDKHKEEISELTGLCERLNKELKKYNKEKLEKKLEKPLKVEVPSGDEIMKTVQKQLKAIIVLDKTTPEEILSKEADEIFKKYNK